MQATIASRRWHASWLGMLVALAPALGGEPSDVSLPPGVRAVWDLSQAARETTATRERICINGLWHWQPAEGTAASVPSGHWGYFKVPGCWPGITDYMQKDCQMVHTHPSWQRENLGGLQAAWYQREFTVPAPWAGRRIGLSVEYLNSYATVYVDDRKVGDVRFPGGEIDLTSTCRPGTRQTLSLLVVALPLQGVMLSYTDSASAREVKGSVARRGLCGDVYLTGSPAGPRLTDVKVDTSFRQGSITIDAAPVGLAADARYALRVQILADGRVVHEFTGPKFTAGDVQDGRIVTTDAWKPDKLWDIHTPQHTYVASVSLQDAAGTLLDTAHAVRFGFREFWIDGRDFYLNGTRIFLSGIPLDNAQISAALASYEGAKGSLLRLKEFGINFVYTHNYGCEPGSHLGFTEILRAAADVGVLVSLSQPHFSHYQWRAADADQNNGYARHAEFYVRQAQNHPAVVCYSMSHNATGYSEDMNPDLIDGRQDPRDQWSANNAKLALRAEAIVRRLDPSRLVYHHSSGNLGTMHTSNFYPNFTPIQELSDWFEHWATQGVKPVFTCEYGAPFTWDWTMYRGWYQGQRSFGSAAVPWEFCFAEWNAQFLGDRAFRISDAEKANLRWEHKQFRDGRLWHRWDYPYEIGSRVFDDRYEVFARYLRDNWRAFRTWGVSANSPWEHGHFWKPRDGVDKRRSELPVDWDQLQRPGFSPDYIEGRYERIDLAFERSDWIATPAAEALIRNNRPLLAYLAGKPAKFTSQDHIFDPGETVEKQLIVINNSRETVTCEAECSCAGPQSAPHRQRLTVPTGQQQRVPLRFALPAELAPGAYEIKLAVRFSSGESQQDAFTMHVLPRKPAVPTKAKIALFDPAGETSRLLAEHGITSHKVTADTDLSGYDILVVGKAALTVDGPGPDVSRVRDGLKVIVFEQTSTVLEQRFGFRVAEYGLRNVFPRVPDHPLLSLGTIEGSGVQNSVLAEVRSASRKEVPSAKTEFCTPDPSPPRLTSDHLRDWRGSATILPSRLKYEMRPQHGPTVQWCGIPVTRAWRCGNYGNVASVLIEKPACGDFLPIVDGGFSLQYSPLLEYREGRGLVLFCQLDVTGRTESEPAAAQLFDNIVQYVSAWQPSPRRRALYIGDPAGKKHLEKAGIAARSYDGGKPAADEVLVVGPGGGKTASANAAAIRQWLAAGGRLLALGLEDREANAFLPSEVSTKQAEHIATDFDPPGADQLLAGVGPADVYNRGPRVLPLIEGGVIPIGNGVLGQAVQSHVDFFQLVPWELDYSKQYNLKRTYRRASFVVSRLLGGMGVGGSTPLLGRFSSPVTTAKPERRWLEGLYLDPPEEMDDPYRFFRW